MDVKRFDYLYDERYDMDEIVKKWEAVLERQLTEDEIELINVTEGEIDLILGYCPSMFSL